MKQIIAGMVLGFLWLVSVPVLAAQVSSGESETTAGDEKVEALQEEIIKIMKVDPNTNTNQNTMAFKDNVNAARDNQNKMMMNAATRAVALGQRAVALATKSGQDDLAMLKDKIEKAENLMSVLDGIAELQAQHLQKINQISSLRGKMLELKAMDGLMAGDIFVANNQQKGDQP